MPISWDTCQGKLQTACGTSPRKKCVAVNKAERNWRFEEHFDVRHGDSEFGVCTADFWPCFGPVFPHYVLLLPFGKRNVYPMLLYVGSI